MTNRTPGAAAESAPGPAPRKRRGGPSGKAGKHLHPLRRFHAPKALFDLIDKAIEHNADSKNNGGYSGWSDWARHHLAIAAADELGIDPIDALKLLD